MSFSHHSDGTGSELILVKKANGCERIRNKEISLCLDSFATGLGVSFSVSDANPATILPAKIQGRRDILPHILFQQH